MFFLLDQWLGLIGKRTLTRLVSTRWAPAAKRGAEEDGASRTVARSAALYRGMTRRDPPTRWAAGALALKMKTEARLLAS